MISYAHFSTESLIDLFEAAPNKLSECLLNLDHASLVKKPRPDKWSIIEIAYHLADSEILAATRIRQTISQSDRLFPYYNQDTWAEVFDYRMRAQPDVLQMHLDLFRLLRQTTALLFKRVEGEHWSRTGIHPERGEMSLRLLLENYVDHSEKHIGQIIAIRRVL